MKIPCAWTISNGNENIRIAIMDEYFDEDHFDYSGKIAAVHGTCDPADQGLNHGTQSIGCAVAIRDNGNCVAGSGGDTKVAIYCDAIGTTSIVNDAVSRGYEIISISTWGYISRAAMENATANGTVVLVAGLDQHHQDYYDVPGVIHVGRCFRNGLYNKYNKSNSADNQNLDLLVDTEGLESTKEGQSCGPGGSGQGYSGTSMGTPLLAGVVSLMMDANPCLTPAAIEEILVQTADPIPSNANSSITRAGKIDAYAAVQMAAGMGSGKTYSGTQTINDDYIGGDLYINHAANITINGTVELADNAEIELAPTSKLTLNGTLLMGESVDVLVRRGSQFIINGGTITTAPCANEWSGIFVDGYSNQSQTMPGSQIGYATNGVVHVKNNSLIENAWTAFSTNSRGIGWPQEQDYRGGLILVENSTIQNCERAVEIINYDFENKSEFMNVIFDGGVDNATHWDVKGVEYNNCTFLNYTQSAISTLDAGVDVYNSDFDGSNINSSSEGSIVIEHTFSGSKVSDIDGNTFDDGYNKILMLSPGNSSSVEITDNTFKGGNRYGIYVLGDGWFSFERNTFIDLTYEGIYLSSTGDNDNIALLNEFNDCEFGIYAFYDNSGFEFERNCFSGSLTKDLGYSGNTPQIGPSAGILGSHGSSFLEAGNTFSSSSQAIGRYGTTDVFNYHIRTGTSTSSNKVPLNYPGNIFDASNSASCGAPSKSDGDAVTRNGEQWISFLDAINSFKGDTYELLKLTFGTLSFKHSRYILGLMISNKDFSEASKFISSLPKSFALNRSQEDFLFTQSLVIDWLSAKEYRLSATDAARLRNIAEQKDVLDGYARSLLHALTGELNLELDKPPLSENVAVTQRNQKIQEITIFPNPVSNDLNLDLSGIIVDEVNISIFNISGQKAYEQAHLLNNEGSEQISINTEGLPPGLYGVIIRTTDGQLLHSQKINKI